MAGFCSKSGPHRVYRVAYEVDVARFPAWRWQQGANRWDDPAIAEFRVWVTERAAGDDVRFLQLMDELETPHGQGEVQSMPFRVLYTADSRVSAYVEVLQDFRPANHPKDLAILAQIEGVEQDDPQIAHEKGLRTGVVPANYFEGKYIGEIEVEPTQ
ncbi:MAG: hypothetical protein JO103_07735, partial [Candidatus Eremiobacteraeota bacterium]|nr:hypothetical protein [Candidatus Eremiobacteraeota bacterium]